MQNALGFLHSVGVVIHLVSITETRLNLQVELVVVDSLTPVPVLLEVEAQVKDATFEATLVPMLVRILPFAIQDLESNIFIRWPRRYPQHRHLFIAIWILCDEKLFTQIQVVNAKRASKQKTDFWRRAAGLGMRRAVGEGPWVKACGRRAVGEESGKEEQIQQQLKL